MAKMNDWPQGSPGNRRTGASRGTKSGKRRGTLPAAKDPVIWRRRELAAPLWEGGNNAREILTVINDYLSNIGEQQVTLQTIYKDHVAIQREWRRNYDKSLEQARFDHLASLDRIKRELWVAIESLPKGENPAILFNSLARVEMDMAKLDGTVAAAQAGLASTKTERFERVYIGVNLEDV